MEGEFLFMEFLMKHLKQLRLWTLCAASISLVFFAGCRATGIDASSEQIYTLSYDRNGGSGSVPEKQSGYVLSVAPGDSLTKSEQTFKFWTNAQENKVYAPGEKIDLESNSTLYAQYSGSGTKDDPYVISNREDLEAVADNPEAFYKVFNGFVISGEWTTLDIEFKGEIDGGGHTITFDDVTIKEITKSLDDWYKETYCALFVENSEEGVIKNLIFDGVVKMGLFADYVQVGGIVANNSGLITNCGIKTAYTIETARGISFGAYSGTAASSTSGQISDSFVSSDINIIYSGNDSWDAIKCGGITGGYATLKIDNCYSESNITVTYTNEPCNVRLGGILGTSDMYDSFVNSCYATGTISAKDFYGSIGGIVGQILCGKITNSVALNDVLDGSESSGRVANRTFSNYTAHNYGLAEMEGIPWESDLDGTDGANVLLTESQSESWWRSNANWQFGYTNTAPWQWDITKLRPVLYWE
jgi:hypothetical protein